MNTVLSPSHKCTHVSVSAFGHVWEAWLLDPPGEHVPCKLPPPFDSWGSNTAWKLKGCDGSHSAVVSCEESTLKACVAAEARRSRMLDNFNVVFGVTRNKAFASAFRAKKQAEAEAAMSEDDVEEDIESRSVDEEDDVEKDEEMEDGAADEEEAEEEEDEDDGADVDDEDEEEEEEEDEVSVAEKQAVPLSSSSSSSDEDDKQPVTLLRKRGAKRVMSAR